MLRLRWAFRARSPGRVRKESGESLGQIQKYCLARSSWSTTAGPLEVLSTRLLNRVLLSTQIFAERKSSVQETKEKGTPGGEPAVQLDRTLGFPDPKNLLRLFFTSKIIFYFLRLFLKTLRKYALNQA